MPRAEFQKINYLSGFPDLDLSLLLLTNPARQPDENDMMPPDRKSWTWWKATTVAGLVAASAGGGIMLFDHPSPTRWLLGLNLLVVGAVALLVSAIGAWLADTSPVAGPAVKAPPARLIFVVRRDRRDLYEQLQAMLGRQENVQVIIDRRDRPRDAFDREVVRRGWSVARVAS